MRPVIKRRREAGDHRSEAFEIGSPPPLSGAGEDMSERPRRRASASPVRSLRRRFRSLPPSAPLGATRPATVHTASGCSLPSAAPHSFGRRFRNVLFSPPHVGGSNSCKLACHGSAFSLQAIPPRVQIQKEGTVSRPPRRVKTSDSQPVRDGLQRGRIQRLGGIGHRQVEEPDVLTLHHGTTATRTRNLGRRRVTLGNNP